MNGVHVFVVATAVMVLQSDGTAFAQDRVVNLRPRDPVASLLLQFGMDRSQTFRELVWDLSQSNVIVYIDVRQDPRYPSAGFLSFIGHTNGWRWVRATIDTGTTDRATVLNNVSYLVETLGHELQHAREIAGAASMKHLGDFEALFRRLGTPVGKRSFDTAEAVAVGRTIAFELRRAGGLAVSDGSCKAWWIQNHQAGM